MDRSAFALDRSPPLDSLTGPVCAWFESEFPLGPTPVRRSGHGRLSRRAKTFCSMCRPERARPLLLFWRSWTGCSATTSPEVSKPACHVCTFRLCSLNYDI